jgi:hypothetical protein
MELLTTLTQVQCQHGATAQVPAAVNQLAAASVGKVLVESDVHLVLPGCAFFRGPQASPCVRITWSNGAQSAKAGGQAALTRNSIGQCFSGDGVLQGLAVIGSTQDKAKAP